MPAQAVSQDKLYLTGRVGILAFIIIKGDIVEKATIPNLKRVTPKIPGTVELEAQLKNTGNVHVLPRGKVKIYNWRGKVVAELPFKPGMVLPGTTREFPFTWSHSGALGRYTAVAEFAYGSENQELKSEGYSFFLLPPILNIIGLIILAPLVFLAATRRQRVIKAVRIIIGKEKYRI